MIYLEFDEWIVKAGRIPATVCCVTKPNHSSGMFNVLAMSSRAYTVVGNEIKFIKNRDIGVGTGYISNEDKVVLKLKAVLISR